MKKIAFCGASQRALSGYAEYLYKECKDSYRIVGVYDIDAGHNRGFCEVLGAPDIAQYTDYEKMLAETAPDEVFISTMDGTHCDYILRTIPHGIDVICEKPLCISPEQCRKILDTLRKYPDVFACTAHNVRYMSEIMIVKELIDSGRIGKINSISFSEFLDRDHGKSYFRRWNRKKADSGGLLIHKASHHFDLLNWLIGSRPAQVMAMGNLIAYGPNVSSYRGKNCRTCSHTRECPHYTNDDRNELRRNLFYKYLGRDGYTPDLCIFDPGIDIEDQATVGIRYENGVGVSYSLTAHSAISGQTLYVEGDKGTLEHLYHSDPVFKSKIPNSIRIHRLHGEFEVIPIPPVNGGHGGADPLICADMFGSDRRKNHRLATLMDGVQAVLVGAAANISMKTGKTVDVQSLLLETEGVQDA